MTLKRAFEHKSYDSQYCFRALLTCMSEPSTIRTLDLSEAFGNMASAMVQVAQTLADSSTPIMLSLSFMADAEVLENMKFYVESPLTQRQDETVFYFVHRDDLVQVFTHFVDFPNGTFEYPEQGTTIIVEVPSVETGVCLLLSGPGIKDTAEAYLGEVPLAFAHFLANRTPSFPLGWDFIFTCGQQVWALPRTTKVEVR